MTASAAAVREAAGVVQQATGMRVDTTFTARLSRVLAELHDEMQAEVEALVRQMSSDPALLQEVVDRLTVQETSFFRDAAQLEAFATEVLPTLRQPVTIWSCGCANGQEPFTLAMILHEKSVRGTVIATDISTRAVRRTVDGVYRPSELRGLSAFRRGRHLTPAGDDRLAIAPHIRARVTARVHNLVTDPPPFAAGECQVVFCRNVLMYLRADVVRRFFDRLVLWLPADAWVFLGYSEVATQLSDEFEAVPVGDAFAARKTGSNAAGVASGGANAGGAAPATLAPEPDDVRSARHEANASPGRPLVQVNLAMALRRWGDERGARRAFATARALVAQWREAPDHPALEGWHPRELQRFIDEQEAAQ